MDKHTPTPWVLKNGLRLYSAREYWICESADGKQTPVSSILNRADAAYIVRSVNLHQELVEMLKAILADSKAETESGGQTFVDEAAIANLIAKAEAAL